ncbi:hypothetical protein FHS61_000082 [Altererythrobacter atlanticus]|uniref:Uncharacterized protein n=1 Tax=Croceibacterium atlanticum TaxID=1267766 RepID=A0A0F7KSR3_9SPHN|nr:hypothetical protein [Croceibacterium atlanticum]AKH42312.1 hypothetical protein WYH_01267 [Croceibacterium atlanticum]MBB5731089.1 hypothetical protein [Croceibacterium atlanticum]
MDFKRILLISAMMVPATACTTAPDSYPSLAIREVERVQGTAQPVESVPWSPEPLAQATLDDAAQLAEDAAEAHRQFQIMAARVASGGNGRLSAEAGSDSWARAQLALASLEASRSRTLVALASLDRLYVTAAVEGAELEQIAGLHRQVSALAEEEDAAIARLEAQLR